MPSESQFRDETVRLSPARLEFAANLNQRLDAIRGFLPRELPEGGQAGALTPLKQELLGLAEGARRLGFAAAAEVVSRLLAELDRPLSLDDQARALFEQRLDNIRSLVLRGSYSQVPPANSPLIRASIGPVGGTLCLFVGVRPTLFERLSAMLVANPGVEMLALAEDVPLESALPLYTPDIVVFDVWTERGRELLQRYRAPQSSAGPTLVVVGALPEQVPEYLVYSPSRVLPHHIPEPQLLRAILGSRELLVEEPRTVERYGTQNLTGLFTRITEELRRGLLDATSEEARRLVIDFDEGIEVRAALLAALARIRQTVEQRSGGRVEFGPTPDGGVPLGWVSERRSPPSTKPLPSLDLSGRRVILAEDDPEVTEPLKRQLSRAGAIVDAVGDGRRALQHAFRVAPDLVISEVMLPQLDGLALCRALKRDIALRDVPVVLISIKEQILAYARELGAEADGYLSQGAPRFDVVPHVAHLLGPRGALEQRLVGAEEVRGRLDGLSLRSLLEMVARARPSARLSVHDACSRYEVELRNGALSEVVRKSAVGEAMRGDAALASLLGITRGRFVVEPAEARLGSEQFQPLAEAIRAPILRSRAAQRVLSSAQIDTIARLVLDSDVLMDEIALFSASLRQLMDELIRGVSPRQLLTASSASAPELESVLLHVARRGAVRSILSQEGQDLLAREVLSLLTPSSDPPPATPVTAEPTSPSPEGSLTPPTPIALPPVLATPSQDFHQSRAPASRVLELSADDSLDLADAVAGALSEISAPILPVAQDPQAPIAPLAILTAEDKALAPPLPLPEAQPTSDLDLQPKADASTPQPEAPPSSQASAGDGDDDEAVFPLISATAPARGEATRESVGARSGHRPSPSRIPSPWLMGAGAVVVGFLVTSLLIGLRDDAPNLATEASSAVVSASSTPSALPSPPQPSAVGDAAGNPILRPLLPLAVPSSMTLPSGKALLEIVTGGAHAIFVDGKFVRRGPSCIMPINPGSHLIETRLGGVETRSRIEIAAGQSGRLDLSPVTAQ